MSQPKKTCKQVLRPATRQDIEEFWGQSTPTLRAWIGEVDGKVIGIGGYAWEGRWVAFLDLKSEGRKYKKLIVRAGREMVRAADIQGIPYLYAQADGEEELADKWLKRLGFVKRGKIYYRKLHG